MDATSPYPDCTPSPRHEPGGLPWAPDEPAPLSELKDIAARRFADLSQRFPLRFSAHVFWRAYRVSAGMAYCSRGKIGLSTTVLHTPRQVEETLVHEYAHLLAFSRHGRKSVGHGPLWQEAMADLGAKPEVRHRYKTVKRNQARQEILYRCDRCGCEFSRTRRFAKGRRYLHVDCGGLLKLHEVRRITPADSIP